MSLEPRADDQPAGADEALEIDWGADEEPGDSADPEVAARAAGGIEQGDGEVALDAVLDQPAVLGKEAPGVLGVVAELAADGQALRRVLGDA